MATKMKRNELILASVAVVAVLILSSSAAYGNIFSYGMFPNMGLMSNTQSSNNNAGMGGMMNGYQMSGDFENGFEMPCTADSEHMVFGDYNIIIGNYEFQPQNLTVKVGTTVTWINMDFVGHNVEAGIHEEQEHIDETFQSSILEHMESFSYTFNESGEYTYHCDPHPYMEGTIIVIE